MARVASTTSTKKVTVTRGICYQYSDYAKLSGAVFGLYSDADCKNLITKLPATDANGEVSAQIVKTQDTVYLKEITAPSGYRINATAYNVKPEVSKTTTVTIPDEEQLGQLTVYKEGEVLTGADVTENGTTFRYEKRRQKGAVYNVYAGADITTAYGTKVYSKSKSTGKSKRKN